MTQEQQENRRLKVYRSLAKVERIEETLKYLYQFHKSAAMQHRVRGNQMATEHYEGRAAGIEELMAKIEESQKPRQRSRKEDNSEEIL